MPVRTAYVGTEAVGDVLTKANFDKLPGGWIGYAEVTANQTGITNVRTDLTSLTVTVTVNANRRIKISAAALVGSSVADDVAELDIMEGASVLRAANTLCRPAATGISPPGTDWIGTPTSGAHSYKLTLVRTVGTGTLTMFASSTFPAFILVEDIGPAS